MRTMNRLRWTAIAIVLCAGTPGSQAQVTFADSFSTPVNYLTNGVNGTLWDGVYWGAGAFAQPTGIGAAPGSVSIADADLSSNNVLTIASLETDWENSADDGVFLFKVITGNFDMSVHVLGPIDTDPYNLPGLMVRAFGPGGSPAPNAAENSFLWARFDEFSIANMLKNNVNGVKTDTGEGTYPNTNYWLRITRSGNLFSLFEKGSPAASWNQVGSLTRADFNGLALEVGIEHSDYAGGTTCIAYYQSFSLTVSNMGPFSAAPSPVTGLNATTNADQTATISWTPAAGSSGTVVVLWTGNPRMPEAPANGFTYTGNALYQSGASLPGANIYVVYAGAGSNVTVSNLTQGTTYYAAAFAENGSGAATAYTHSSAIVAFTTPSSPPSAATLTNLPATAVGTTSAVINGQVLTTGGSSPEVTLCYGTTDGGTNASNWANSIFLGVELGPFSVAITNLSPGTTYYFAARGANVVGTNWATPSQFFTTLPLGPAQVANLPALNVAGNSATLGGQVLSTGGSTPVVTLFYGVNDGGTTASAWAHSVSLGSQSGAFSFPVGGLAGNTTYYFTCQASNQVSVSWASPSLSFTTASGALFVLTNSYTNSFPDYGLTVPFTGGSVASWVYAYTVYEDPPPMGAGLTGDYNIPMTNDPTMDAQGQTNSSGSLLVVSPFGTSGDKNDFYGTFNYQYCSDMGEVMPLNIITNMAFDIHVAPGTKPDSAGNFGTITMCLVDATAIVNTRSYFDNVAVTTSSASPPPPPPPVFNPRSGLLANAMTMGIVFDGVDDWSTYWPFVDVFKRTRTWATGNLDGSGPWDTGFESLIPVDTNGWPTQVPIAVNGTNQLVRTIMVCLNEAGAYNFIYEGTGTLSLSLSPGEGGGYLTATGGVQSVSFTTPIDSALAIVQIYSSASNDYLRNFHIVLTNFLATYQIQPFHPLFLQRLQPFGCLRFVLWGAVPDSTLMYWTNRTTPSYYTQANPNGVALEYMVQLCNTLQENAWICIPAAADDNYIQQTAELLYNTLSPNLRIYVEYSNETWNGVYSEYDYVITQGLNLGLDSDPFTAGEDYVARRSGQIWNIFQQVFGSAAASRLVKVMATQGCCTGVTELRVHGLLDTNVNVAGVLPDALAIAPYLSINFTPSDLPPNAPYPTVDDILTNLAVQAIATQQSGVFAHKIIADANGWWLVCYEGGQSFLGIDGAESDTNLTAILEAANLDPRMGSLYTQYLNMLAANGVNLFNHYSYCGNWGEDGCWGALEYQDQPTNAAPKYDALVQWIAANPFPLAPPSVIASASQILASNGATVTFAAVTNGGAPPSTYQWYDIDQNGNINLVAGQTNLTLTLTGVGQGANSAQNCSCFQYFLLASNANGVGSTLPATLTVEIPPTIVRAFAEDDSFSTPVNYLENGLVGTIWDGVYFGSGEFDNTAGGQASTVQCDADISSPGALTLQTTGTAWECADDDGFFLFKVVPGDFSVVVEVNTPFDNSAYNTAGLQVRAFSPNGNAFNGSENFISWTRFDEYGFANYLRNNIDGQVTQINPGDYPNGAYWLRIDRVQGTNFTFLQRTNSSSPWKLVTFPAPVNGTTLTRTDFAGLPLQVGIMHATFNGQLGVSFSNFSITESNATFAATPPPATNLVMATNANETLSLSWTPGPGSAGSLVALWTSTNLVKEIPANGFTYTGNAEYGSGSALPGATYFVVYAGTNSSVTVSNVVPGMTYYAGVYAYAGSGTNTSYSHTPATASLSVPNRGISGAVTLGNGDVYINFTANPGKWYWLQYSDTLSPPNWQNVGPLPTIATNLLMTLVHRGGAGASQRFYRLVQLDPEFGVQTEDGTITSLVRNDDVTNTEYLSGPLGAVMVNYGVDGANWSTATTSPLSGATATYSTSQDGTVPMANYQMTTGLSGPLVMEFDFAMQQSFFTWTLGFTNLGASPVIVGDVAVQFPMNTASPQFTSSVFKHSVISGSGSFIFWMRNNSVGPYLLMTPDNNTSFEYWDTLASGGVYEAYIHSAVSGPLAEAQYPTVTNSNARWRLPNTSLTLAPGASTNYTLKFQWVNDYDGVRRALINEGKVDVHVVPGMTVPTNLFAEIALNTTQPITSITAEFPQATQLQSIGANGPYQLYRVQFSQLGENMLTINYGVNQTMYLEFCVTEPMETLFKKRASFLVSHQQWAGITNWFNGLFADWNENDQVQNSPINYDTISGFVIYEVASDDAGESRPAYMAEKESVYPVQREVSALDLYITNFVWPPGPTGGLQRKTNETYSYGVYGIDNWYELRASDTLSLGRTYDYPHLVDTWFSMYRVAKYNPQITTAWAATNYLQAAWGTALALYTVAGAGPSTPGLMSEVVFPDLLDALHNEGMTNQEAQLRPYWESKVAFYATGNPNLFGSEYGFDSTGFEATEAFARYAMTHAGSDSTMGSADPSLFLQQTSNFMSTQVTANMFDRGFLETAYYHYGSDFRGGGSDNYCLSYMTQMGGWGLLDYALNYAANFPDYLRLGYGSFLAGWAIMNTGTPASNCGFWYHGSNNDGACGGGYEPQAYFDTWLGQRTHRGPWYYSSEQNLGFCGAVRSAATILADDPIFGRFCFGGILQTNGSSLAIVPLDGIRRCFHALLTNGVIHLLLQNDRFAATAPIVMQNDFSQITFQIESDNPSAHSVTLLLTVPVSGTYTISGSNPVTLTAGQQTAITLSMPGGSTPQPFVISQ